jgi:phenylpropionate dioxygenase-like ring-hydroxylating dioxygenase large terminal subunit
MADSPATLPILSSATAALPRECTFSESDWRALAPYWYPVAFAHEVGAQPVAVRLLDERVVVYRLSDGKVFAARDICLHRGVPLSMGHVEGDEIICKYHGLRYDRSGQCVCIPAHPKGAISPRLHLTTYGAREAYGLIWVRLVDDGEESFPDFSEWNDPEFIQVLPESVTLAASAGRQVEGFLDVAHFAFIHTSSFGEADNAVVPDYPVEKTADGFVADYISTVSNYSHGFKHLAPADFPWRRRFQVFFPFTAKLTIYFPSDGRLNILNTASPISALRCRRRSTSTAWSSRRTRRWSRTNIRKTCQSIFTPRRIFRRTGVRLPTARGWLREGWGGALRLSSKQCAWSRARF